MAEPDDRTAVRAIAHGAVQGVGFRDAVLRRARTLGLAGWVRNAPDGTVHTHAEGAGGAVEQLLDFLQEGPRLARVDVLDIDRVTVEGHEQFAIRGVSAGTFLVTERAGRSGRFALHLEVGAGLRSWSLPKGPAMDPAAKRLAVELAAQDATQIGAEGDTAIVWDRGHYEQGGRVAWPDALERGHAVFVLHGEKLRGGFALQRTRPGDPAQWLLIKRKDEEARPGSDVVAERPGSVLSARPSP